MAYKRIGEMVMYLLRCEDTSGFWASPHHSHNQETETMNFWLGMIKGWLWTAVALLMSFGIACLTSNDTIL